MRRTLLIATIILLSVGACSAADPPDQESGRFPLCRPEGLLSNGERLPDCTFEGLPGHPDLELAALKGKPSILNFWASWCPNCIKEMPDFDKVWRSLEGAVTFVGMDVLGVQGETRAAAAEFARSTDVGYRLAFDPSGYFYGHFGQRSARPIMPVTVFVDSDLVVRDKRFGQLTEEDLREHIHRNFGL